MNWLNQLLRSSPPPEMSPAQRGSARTPRSRDDIARMRREAAAAADASERERARVALGQALSESGTAPEEEDDALVWAAACGQVADKALALAWLERVRPEALLAQIAQHARHAELRLAAARRISDPAILEELGRAAKGHDKNVYRHCSDVLRERRMAQGRRARAAQIDTALRELLAAEPVSVSRLIEIERELGPLMDAAPSPEDPDADAASLDAAIAACRALQEQANGRVRLEGEQGRRMQSVRQQAHELVAELRSIPWPDADAHARASERLRAFEAAVFELPAWLHAQTSGVQSRQALEQAGRLLAELAEDAERLRACEELLGALEAPVPVAPAAEAARERWSALVLPRHAEARRRLEERWAQAARRAAPADLAAAAAPEKLEAPAEEAARAPRLDVPALRASLDELEAALEQGHLAQADGIVRRIRETLGSAMAPRREHARLQRAMARHESLHGWAKWSAKQQRGQLIQAARELIGGDVEQIAVAVPALREAWKRLNAQGQASKVQWQVFDEAIEKAYAPVATQRAQEAEQRSAARSRKGALLEQWEAWLASIDGHAPDLAQIERQREEIATRWRSEPHAGFGDERRMRKRLQALLTRIDERLQSARQAESARRRELIAAAEALVSHPDLRHATAQIKSLQEHWRSPAGAARLARHEEQELWKAFRGVCDQVFARRDAQRGEVVARAEQRNQARAALLDELAAVLQSTEAGQIEAALRRFAGAWRHAASHAPDARPRVDSQERRAADLQRQARQRVEQLRAAAYREQLEQMQRLAPSSDGLDEAQLEQGRQAREDILIELELALDLPSPESCAAARRKRQIEQLQNRFKGRAQPAPAAEGLLARLHAIAAAPDAQQAGRLDAIVERMAARRPASA